MSEKRYVVRLSEDERLMLSALVKKERGVAARKRMRAQVLLKVDQSKQGPAWTDEQTCDALEVHLNTVRRIRQELVEQGLEAALERRPQVRPSRSPSLDASGEKELIAIAQSDPPKGRARWTLHLLAGRLVELKFVDSISHETVRKTLKNNSLQPHLQVAWVLPPEHDGEYVARMEDVLALYHQPHDSAAPVLCMDEQPVQLTKEVRVPVAPAPGRPKRVDYEYERAGTAVIFMFNEPHTGWRQAHPTERRTRIDWALEMRELLNGRYTSVPKVRLVMDNLNTHTIGSLYEAFPPAEARRLAERLEIHYTPKHGSWLNLAENELSALTRQCLSRRIGKLSTLKEEVAAWESKRNADCVRIHWRFTIDRAREKLARVYPQIQS